VVTEGVGAWLRAVGVLPGVLAAAVLGLGVWPMPEVGDAVAPGVEAPGDAPPIATPLPTLAD